MKIQLQLHFGVKSHQTPLFWSNTIFFNQIIWKPTVKAFQNTLTFDKNLFNSRSNMHVNLDYLLSLHPKDASLPTFSEKNTTFSQWKASTRNKNLHHQKAVSIVVFWGWGWGLVIQKKCNNLFNWVAAKYTLFLARPHILLSSALFLSKWEKMLIMQESGKEYIWSE